MFNIQMYQFNKRINSTKRPTEAGDTFSCEMKESSSILFPVVEIRTGNSNSIIPLYNYAYISEFNRYYWIDDIVYDMGYWTITMHCDALASFRIEILATKQYVIRSSSASDNTIADTLYITKAGSFISETDWAQYQGVNGDRDKVYVVSPGGTAVQKYFNVDFTSGRFVVGIVGNNTAGVTYYSFSNGDFKNFINSALTFTPSDMNDVSSGVANAVFNPIQYITSVRWFPISPYYTGTTTSIKVGGYTIPGSYTAGVVNVGSITRIYFDIGIPKHPSGYPYMNLSPFTDLSLILQPFGVVPLDTTKLMNTTKINIEIDIDFCYGQATLFVSRSIPNASVPQLVRSGLIYTVSTEYGVTLPISSLVMDWKAGAVVSALQFVKSAVSGSGLPNPLKKETTASSSNSAGRGRGGGPDLSSYSRRQLPERADTSVDVSLLDKAMDLTASALGQISTSGAVGSFLAYINTDYPYVEAWFKSMPERDILRFGMPLYKMRTLSTLNGICVCMNATFDCKTAMEEEIATIQTVLNTGVYIE